ncbi:MULTISPECIES: precorrin-6y C5,15-methyltransferase (decarboxylating) subunit CbiE [unclassified Nocardioides]|uniref:precorrin-6y C5,15-methyltransferase (decarboxylating) subunit CbiE n=1 Tax=unclassified Nocardioides TaxID=2615069 RepID=UPI003015026F
MPADPAQTAARIVVAAVCLRDDAGRVLAVRKRGTTRFMQPGGKLEPGETPAQAAVREVREEIGLDVEVRYLGEFTTEAANEPGAVLESTVFTAELTGTPVADGEIEELRWVEPDATDADLAPLLRDHVLPALAARVTVVGVDAQGRSSAPDLVAGADVLLGGARHLDLVPPVAGQVRRPWPSPLRPGLAAELARHAGRRVVALASGDPLVSGIGSTLVDLLGADAVELHPAVSSVALARARMGWPAETTAVVTVVGRDPHAVLRELAPGRRVLVLSSDERTPAEVARLLIDARYGASAMTVLGDLGAPTESRATGTAASWNGTSPRLHVLALDLDGPVVGSWATGLPDEAFEHDGQLTKRDQRAVALARLQPQPGQLLWDVGAGAGSVGIEWMRAHPSCRTAAVEADPERAARIARNAAALGVPALEVVTGRAPDVLPAEAPDAIFVGGGATAPGLLDACVARLRPGGRLVVHGVTVETEVLLAERYADLGGELTRVGVEHAAPIGSFTGWTPARTVTQWSWSKHP